MTTTATHSSSILPGRAEDARCAERQAPVVWRQYRALDEVNRAGLAEIESCLGERELAELSRWRDSTRRRAWLVGRALARRLLADAMQELQSDSLEILSRDAQGRMNRPGIWLCGTEQPWSLSISHSPRGALVALCVDERISVGVDLALCQSLSDSFIGLWFTRDEQQWCRASASPATASFIWAAKEAVYKAAHRGESFVPRDVEIRPDGSCNYRQRPLAGCQLEGERIDEQQAVIATLTTSHNTNAT